MRTLLETQTKLSEKIPGLVMMKTSNENAMELILSHIEQLETTISSLEAALQMTVNGMLNSQETNQEIAQRIIDECRVSFDPDAQEVYKAIVNALDAKDGK